MTTPHRLFAPLFFLVALGAHHAFAQKAVPVAKSAPVTKSAPNYQDLIKSAKPSYWRPIDNDNTFYLELETGRVIIELAPQFAPLHVANIKTLVREGYFDGLVIMRVQENYVVQWGDPTEKKMPLKGKKNLPPEFSVPVFRQIPFTRLPDVDEARVVGPLLARVRVRGVREPSP